VVVWQPPKAPASPLVSTPFPPIRGSGKSVSEAAEAAGGGEGGGGAASRKKRRVSAQAGAAGVPAAPHQQEPSGALAGHVHCVSALCWAGGGAGAGLLASGGWDHSVRLWDAGAAREVATYNGSKAVYAVAAAPDGGGGVLVFGGADTAIRVWDARARGEALSVKGYAAGDAWLSALAWRPGSEHHVAGVSHDGSLRLWDLRTPVPLGTVTQHADKALAVAWWGPGVVASGGADCKLQLYELPG
jgi:ribosome biogenesis protein